MTYYKLIWKNHRSFALFSMVFITLLQYLILYLITTFNMPAIIQTVLLQMPEKLKIYLNESFFSTLSLDGAAAFGFNHPITLTLLAMIAINIPSANISHELEGGTMELILSYPFRRQSLIFKLWISGSILLLGIILTAVLGSISAVTVYHQLSMGIFTKLIKIGINLWLFCVLVMTYTMLIAVVARTGSMAGNIAAIITFFFYLAYFVSQLWNAIEFTKPFNIFTYYEPQKLMFGQANFFLNCSVLGALIIVCFLISRWQFNRRDIP